VDFQDRRTPSSSARKDWKKLLLEVEKRLAALGCIKINLQVVETNSAVVRFYEEAGYEIEPRISMSKRLPSRG
jgi:ribosomal protein S18 acetylase RimI-like enzyme